MLFTLLRYKDVTENEGRDTFVKREDEPDNFFAEDDGEDN